MLQLQDHLWIPAIAKERELSQSSSPPLESPDDIASGLSSDEEEKPRKAEEPAVEKSFLIAQSPRSERQRDNVQPRLPSMVEHLLKCCIGTTHIVAYKISMTACQSNQTSQAQDSSPVHKDVMLIQNFAYDIFASPHACFLATHTLKAS